MIFLPPGLSFADQSAIAAWENNMSKMIAAMPANAQSLATKIVKSICSEACKNSGKLGFSNVQAMPATYAESVVQGYSEFEQQLALDEINLRRILRADDGGKRGAEEYSNFVQTVRASMDKVIPHIEDLPKESGKSAPTPGAGRFA